MLQYIVLIIDIKEGLNPKAYKVFHKNKCSTLSKAFSWSREIKPQLIPKSFEESKISLIKAILSKMDLM